MIKNTNFSYIELTSFWIRIPKELNNEKLETFKYRFEKFKELFKQDNNFMIYWRG